MTGSTEGKRGDAPGLALHGRCEAILDAATFLFAEHGYTDADTQEIADRLSIGKGTLYRHFASKRELFLAAVDRVMKRLRERVEACTGGIEDPCDCISQGVQGALEFFSEHPEFVELIIQERALFKDRKKPTFLEHSEMSRVRWSEFYRSLIEQGRLRAIPPERISDVVSRLVYGTIFTNYFSDSNQRPDVQAREIMDVVFFGILSNSERRRQGLDA